MTEKIGKYIILYHKVNDTDEENWKDMPDEVDIVHNKVFDTLEEANDYLLDLQTLQYRDYDTKFIRNEYLFIYKSYYAGWHWKYTYRIYYRIKEI